MRNEREILLYQSSSLIGFAHPILISYFACFQLIKTHADYSLATLLHSKALLTQEVSEVISVYETLENVSSVVKDPRWRRALRILFEFLNAHLDRKCMFPILSFLWLTMVKALVIAFHEFLDATLRAPLDGNVTAAFDQVLLVSDFFQSLENLPNRDHVDYAPLCGTVFSL